VEYIALYDNRAIRIRKITDPPSHIFLFFMNSNLFLFFG